MLKRIDSGDNHRYNLDGLPVTGVTSLISKGVPKPGLPAWSARVVAEYVADADPDILADLRMLGRDGFVHHLKRVPWVERNAAAARGKTVHRYAERLARGERVDVPDDIAGHVESCVRFLDEWQPTPVITEAIIGSRTCRYAGTLDMVADLPGEGVRAIMDYKTGKIYPEVALQLAAYRHADFYVDPVDGNERPMMSLGITCGYVVQIRADDYDVIPVDTSQRVFDTFQYVAHVAQTIDGPMKSWVGVPQRRPVTV